MKIFGTGGISDVVTYLEKRRNIHRKLEKQNQSSINSKAMKLESDKIIIDSSIAQLILNTLDAQDLAGFINHFTEEALFCFGSQEIVKGKKNIALYVESFLQGMKSIRHKINFQGVIDSKFMVEGIATYITTDGLEATIPFCDVWIFDQSSAKIIDYRVYCDPTPLMN